MQNLKIMFSKKEIANLMTAFHHMGPVSSAELNVLLYILFHCWH